MSADWERVESIFQRALDLPADARNAFVGETCCDDEVLHEVRSLLAAHDVAEQFTDIAPVLIRVERLASPEANFLDDRRVGAYAILRELGTGGTSTVFLGARADDEFRRLVAVKILKKGLSRPDFLQRFRTERQILADLEHPNIARLYEGGSVEDGTPYFVMEYVDGEPIDAYCDRELLGLEDRLRIFRKVCSAVSYAHRNLIIHRDIKPTNILVSGDGQPKLLDFGIAKLVAGAKSTGGRQAPTPRQRRGGKRPLTPVYASPEQLQGRTITPASDVYALGLLLYKLLAGVLPHGDSLEARRQALAASPDPVKPSDAIAALIADAGGETQAGAIALARRTEPEKLARRLSGDLDAIVFKALRRHPRERYRSVERFSADVERHLQGRPVAARSNAPTYRTCKFVNRNRWVLAAVVLTSLTTLAITSVMTRSHKEPAGLRGTLLLEEEVGLADRLEEAGRDLLGTGYAPGAEGSLRGAYEIRGRLHGYDSPKTAVTAALLAESLIFQERWEEAESLLLAARSVMEARRDEAPDAYHSVVVGLRNLYEAWGKTEEASRDGDVSGR